MFVLFSKYVRAVNVMKSGWQVRWTRSMGQARNVHVWSQNLKRRNYWVDLGLDNRIILKCILDKCGSGWTRYCNLAFHKRRALDRGGGRQLCSLVTAVSAYLEASATERRRGVAVSCQWVHYCPSLTHPPPNPPLPLSQTRTTRFST